MTTDAVIAALSLPVSSRIDQRVPKKLLVENGAPTAADKRQINDGIDELVWVAALKPANIGVPAFRDPEREYLEIAVLSLRLRAEAKSSRLTELIHRSIPYPVFLIQSQVEKPLTLSLAHIRWSQGQAAQTVMDGVPVAVELAEHSPGLDDFMASLSILHVPRRDLHALYQTWIEHFEAFLAAAHTGRYRPAQEGLVAERRRLALTEHNRLCREVAGLRARAERESQVNRRVELNLQIKQLESRLADTARDL